MHIKVRGQSQLCLQPRDILTLLWCHPAYPIISLKLRNPTTAKEIEQLGVPLIQEMRLYLEHDLSVPALTDCTFPTKYPLVDALSDNGLLSMSVILISDSEMLKAPERHNMVSSESLSCASLHTLIHQKSVQPEGLFSVTCARGISCWLLVSLWAWTASLRYFSPFIIS